MKKSLFVSILCVLMLVCLSACRSGSEPRIDDPMGIMNENAIWMTYSLFNGTKDYLIDVRGDSEISVEVETRSGSMSIVIAQEGQAPIYKGTLEGSHSFKVGAKDGSYTITLTGKKHQGSFSFNW